MAKTTFTKASVDAIDPPATGQERYFERLKRGLTLGLWVSYAGTRSWRVVYYAGGKPQTKALGTYPQVSVAEARKRAFEFDPEKAIASSAAGTFQQVAEDWMREYVDEKRLRSKPEIERILRVYVFPAWGKRPIFDIRRLDVNQLLDTIKHKNGRGQADAVLATIRGVMSWYEQRDDNYNSPITRGMKRDKREASERSRDRILSDDEIRAVWSAAGRMGTYGDMIKLLLLTGQRLAKVAGMRWSDMDGGVWVIRTEPREKGNAGSLRLSPMASAIIAARRPHPGNDHVFPAQDGKGSGQPLNSFSQRKKELDRLLPAGMAPWVVHDLRRTARSLLARAGVPDHIGERVLGHKLPGMHGVYNRYDYGPEKTDALDKLAHLVGMILNPPAGTNVVSLRG